ncbi:MAG: EAL domain-containing protein [Sulfurospirillaceae bacterium]|nr:EAL domain-containing protein [Sulfurospirillaceae bacterium]
MSEIYIAKQPIIDAKNEIFGYELLFRAVDTDGVTKAIFDDELLATAKVLVNALNHFGINTLVDDSYAFVNVDHEFLMDQLIFSIPKERFVLEILEDTRVDEKTVARIKELKDAGFKLALDDAHCNANYTDKFCPLFPYLDFIKVDVLQNNKENADKYFEFLKEYDFTILAEKVETKEDYEFYKKCGCELFQGYYFAKPDVVTKKSLDPAYKNIFKIINMLDDDDVSVSDVAKVFEKEVELTIQLLRFMNSGFMGIKKEVKSIPHMLALLGKKPLRQWLLLIAFSKSIGSEKKLHLNPVFVLAQTRAKLMSELVACSNLQKHLASEASFVGLLSLLDIILGVPMGLILDELNLDKTIHLALTKHVGDIGELLQVVLAVESFDIKKVSDIVTKLSISNETFSQVLQRGYLA